MNTYGATCFRARVSKHRVRSAIGRKVLRRNPPQSERLRHFYNAPSPMRRIRSPWLESRVLGLPCEGMTR